MTKPISDFVRKRFCQRRFGRYFLGTEIGRMGRSARWSSDQTVRHLLGDYTVRAKSDGKFFDFLSVRFAIGTGGRLSVERPLYCLPTGTARRLPDKQAWIS